VECPARERCRCERNCIVRLVAPCELQFTT